MLTVGPGLRQRMAEHRDHPLSDEEYHGNADGTVWSRVLGTKGWYFASNATGEWETFGPFGDAE